MSPLALRRFWRNPRGIAAAVLFGAAAAVTGIGYAVEIKSVPAASAPRPIQADTARSLAAFAKVASVLRNPRCINCHTATDFPRQGNDGHPHIMNVRRGDDNHGSVGMRCSTCHQDFNQANGVPGAPKWSVAPLTMRWEGLNDHDLAEALKDPARNGHRSLEEMAEHMAHDELVGWGWHPGGTRDAIPVSRDEFVRAVHEWIDTGAASPPAR